MGGVADTRDVAVTEGHLLGGRVRYAQPREGFRSGIEPVLLAATLPARAGDRVLEGGSGAGAALLCLATRVPALGGLGIEQEAALVSLAIRNAANNGFDQLAFVQADICTTPALGLFDHACANPPYHAAVGTPSPDTSRRTAKQADEGLLTNWTSALAHQLRPRGTLTFILPAALLPTATAAFAAAGCQPTGVLPLWPKAGRPAKLALLRGIKGSKSPFRVLPGLVLHRSDDSFTSEAEAILRDVQPLPFGPL